MTERLKEQLSVFLDGELPEAETTLLLKRLERDEDLRGTLSRYSLIGAVMRTDGDVPATRHVAARVSAVIAREPALGRAGAGRWQSAAAGLALAAGVAVAAVLLMPQWPGAVDAGPGQLSAGLAAPVPASGPVTVIGEQEVVPAAALAAVDEAAPAYTIPPVPAEHGGGLPSAQLAAYLVAHSEYTSPLARRSVVTSQAEDTPAAPAGGADAGQ